MAQKKSLANALRENAVMREALDWYAFKGNWRRRGVNPKGAPRKWEKSPAAHDRGARARVVIDLIDSPRPGPLRRLFERLMRKPAARVITTPAPLAKHTGEDTE
jgi:hypothetical protein